MRPQGLYNFYGPFMSKMAFFNTATVVLQQNEPRFMHTNCTNPINANPPFPRQSKKQWICSIEPRKKNLLLYITLVG